uniref:Nucleolus and neural progenitor protein-like N-terminal domain-containing protein n=1 Tax=Magallana gigas TaxID=29159 RepID=K1RXZ8_MAGGI
MECGIESVWNNRFLRPPPVISLPAPLMQQDKVKIVLKILKEMQEDKEKQDILVQEKFILSRIIYKLNAQLRSEKTLQCLKRIKVCLSKLTEMKMEKTVEDYLGILKQSNLMARTPYLPSQQMIEHLLVRLIGARYLYRQIANFCSTAYLPEGSILPSTIAEPEDESDESVISQSASSNRKIVKDRNRKEKDDHFYEDVDEEEEEEEEEERGISADTDQDFATESLAENDVLGSKFNSQQEDSSKIKRKNSVRVQSRTDSNQVESSEDEGEVVSRDEQRFGSESCPQVLSEDEGQPVTRTGHIEKSGSPGSSEDEGEPVSRYNPLKEEGLAHKRMKVPEDESEGNDDESDRTVIKIDDEVESVFDENIVQNSSVDELLQLLSNMKMASQEETCLVQTCVETLRKLKGGSTKKGQKKKVKKARKLITELNAELAHIRTTCQKEGANEKVKKQDKKMNKPQRSNNEAMKMTETKAGKKRKCDLDCDELDTMKKKGKLSPKSDEQNGEVSNRVSSNDNKLFGVCVQNLWISCWINKMACPGCKSGGVCFKCDKCGALQCKNKSCKHHHAKAASSCGSCGKSGGQKSV